MKVELHNPILRIVSEEASKLGLRSFVIGGYVRDYFLGRENDDIDVVVEGSGIELARAIGARVHSRVSVFKNFGTAMLRYRGVELEFVGARKESYSHDSRKPIVEDGTLEDDQKRRDFTINAMAFSLCPEDYGTLVDPFGGVHDLDAGIIRTPLDPDVTYSDDPLRMIRAVRFACKLSVGGRKFEICQESLDSIKRNAYRLEILSRERIVEEVNKILMTPKPSIGIRLLYELDLLQKFLPELCALAGCEEGHKDNFAHTMTVLDNVAAADKSRNVFLRWAAMLHDIGKASVKRFDPSSGWSFHGHDIAGGRMVPKIFARLKMPLNEKMKYVQKLVSLHMRPIALVTDEVTDSAVRRLLFDAGEDIDDLMLLCRADITTKNPLKLKAYLYNYDVVLEKMAEVEAKDALRNFQNPINGEYVMRVYGIEPCSAIGTIKEYVKEAILEGTIPNTFEAADALMREFASRELGLEPKE